MKLFATLFALTTLALAWSAPSRAQNPALSATPNVQVLTRGTINAVIRLSDGSVVIGGNFVSVAGVPRRNLAKLKADGTLDATWNPSPNGSVTAIARDAQRVAEAGDLADAREAIRRRQLERAAQGIDTAAQLSVHAATLAPWPDVQSEPDQSVRYVKRSS